MTNVEMEVEASLLQSLEELLLRSERLITSCLYYVIFKSIPGNIKFSLKEGGFHST